MIATSHKAPYARETSACPPQPESAEHARPPVYRVAASRAQSDSCTRGRWPSRLRAFLGALVSLATLLPISAVHARGETLVLAVQPVLGEAQTHEAFKALADFIGNVSGKPCVIRTQPNFMAYWETMRKGNEYDFILDAAHFTDYRAKKLGYTILAKIPDNVSYSLVVRDDRPIIDPMELIARPVASLGIPSIGAARLNAMFPNPARQPITVEVESAEAGVDMVLEGRVAAAILPTPIVSQRMQTGGRLLVVTTTEPIPHIALSAAPSIDADVRERVRQALLGAEKTPAGKAMLGKIGFERFVPATPALYHDQSRVLQEYWGF